METPKRVNQKDYKPHQKIQKKNNRDVQFFITQKDFKYKKSNVFEDSDDFIRKLFFKYYFSCGNYIIIRPNGEFLLRRGEYRKDEIRKK
ncbi:MAG: hypothetical protein ACK5IC_05665 [Moheibacter sp.]